MILRQRISEAIQKVVSKLFYKTMIALARLEKKPFIRLKNSDTAYVDVINTTVGNVISLAFQNVSAKSKNFGYAGVLKVLGNRPVTAFHSKMSGYALSRPASIIVREASGFDLFFNGEERE